MIIIIIIFFCDMLDNSFNEGKKHAKLTTVNLL